MSGAIRHTAKTKVRTIQLYKGGWSPTEILRILAAEGHTPPSEMTLWRWTHPQKAVQVAKRENRSQRERRTRRASFAWPGVRGPEWKVERMRVMHEKGLTPDAIALMMSLDFPKDPELTAMMVRNALRTGAPPYVYRRAPRQAEAA